VADALRATVLEPPVLAAIDLDQLAETIPAMARLVDALDPVAPALCGYIRCLRRIEMSHWAPVRNVTPG